MENLGCGGWIMTILGTLFAAALVCIFVGYFLHVGWSGFTPSPY